MSLLIGGVVFVHTAIIVGTVSIVTKTRRLLWFGGAALAIGGALLAAYFDS